MRAIFSIRSVQRASECAMRASMAAELTAAWGYQVSSRGGSRSAPVRRRTIHSASRKTNGTRAGGAMNASMRR